MFVNTQYPQVVYAYVPMDQTYLWIVIVSFVFAFFLAFGVGANDVANSFGTSVGSKVLSLRQACLLATLFEILGAVMMGYRVSETIRTGMIFPEQFEDNIKLLMFGYLAALIGASIWNLVATLFGMPVSGTHSIVGAIIGFALVAKGIGGVKWAGLGKIVASWFVSPILSGFVSWLLWIFIKRAIIDKKETLKCGLIALPFFYAATVFINIFSITHQGPHFFKDFNWWIALLTGLGCALLTGLFVWFWYVPRKRDEILTAMGMNEKPKDDSKGEINQIELESFDEEASCQSNSTKETNGNVLNGLERRESPESPTKVQTEVVLQANGTPAVRSVRTSSDANQVETNVDHEAGLKPTESEDDRPEVSHLFTYLQILTACFGSFAHGGNDVSNAIGPLVAVMMLYETGNQSGETDWYILLYGGVGISVGLWIWGRRVIKTMGTGLTKITPSSGFTIEIGAAATVLMASKIGLPVSTTHCKVGSVVIVGKARGGTTSVNWRLFGSISIAWVLTLPLTAVFSAAAMFILMQFL